MDTNNYIDHLSEIKDILSKRTKFYALSGLSGIIAGLLALIGAFMAYRIIYTADSIVYDDIRTLDMSSNLVSLVSVFVAVLILAVATGLYFSSKKAQKNGDTVWTPAAFAVLKNFMAPMILGGIFIIILYIRGYTDMISGTCLAFYGMSLFTASNYTFIEIRYLSICMMITAVCSLVFPGFGLFFWAFGFGVLHIVYGSLMYFKYER